MATKQKAHRAQRLPATVSPAPSAAWLGNAEFLRVDPATSELRRPNIVADLREKPSGIPELLTKMSTVHVVVQKLPVGDYLLDGRVLIERKTLRDFAVSIVDRRLFRQAAQMAQQRCVFAGGAPTQVGFLIEGGKSDLRGVQMSRESLLGAMTSLTLVYGFPVFRTSDASGSAKFLAMGAGQLARSKWRDFDLHGRKPRRLSSQQLFVLSSFPGVGPAIARRLLEQFGSLGRCVVASTDELARVKGVGVKVAERLRAILDTEFSPPAPPKLRSSCLEAPTLTASGRRRIDPDWIDRQKVRLP